MESRAAVTSKLKVMLVASLMLFGGACDRGGDVQVVPQSFHPPPPTPVPNVVAKATPTPIPPDAADLTIMPGIRIGPIKRHTNREDLTKIFGAKVLQDTEVSLEDGTVEPATRIKRGRDNSATVIWWDANRAKVKEMRSFGRAWKTPEGIGMGSSLAQIEEAVGPFKIYGFGWAYAGTVDLDGTRYQRYANRLYLRMKPTDREPSLLTRASGDRSYTSPEKEMRAVKPVVAEMVVSLDPLPTDSQY